MTAEIELKLAIDPRAGAATVAALKRHPAVAAARRGRWRRAQVTSTYYDTTDWRLAEAGIALRVRRYGKRWLQTVKGPALAEGGAGLHARPEYEWPLAAPELDTARLATTPWRKLFGELIAEGALGPRFCRFQRRSGSPSPTRQAGLCIDQGRITLRKPGPPGRRGAARHHRRDRVGKSGDREGSTTTHSRSPATPLSSPSPARPRGVAYRAGNAAVEQPCAPDR
jgi:hypothetical protein